MACPLLESDLELHRPSRRARATRENLKHHPMLVRVVDTLYLEKSGAVDRIHVIESDDFQDSTRADQAGLSGTSEENWVKPNHFCQPLFWPHQRSKRGLPGTGGSHPSAEVDSRRELLSGGHS